MGKFDSVPNQGCTVGLYRKVVGTSCLYEKKRIQSDFAIPLTIGRVVSDDFVDT